MQHRWRFALTALLAVALMTLAAACGGDDNSSKDSDSTPGASSSQSSAPSTGTAASAPNTGTAASGASPAGGNVLEELQASSQDFIKADYDIVYAATIVQGGTTTKTDMVIKKKGLKTYLSLTGDLDDSGSDTRFIFLDDGTSSYLCNEAEKVCLKTGASNSAGSLGQIFPAVQPDKVLEEIASEDGAKVSKAPGQKIAGRDADCYNASSSEGDGIICFDKKTNFMLSVNMNAPDGSKNSFEATKVSDNPSDDDFKPPYPVQDLGSLLSPTDDADE